jgi:tetratricopeptide (TPR) repeat protein
VASESPRIAELRRRVHADPASIAFAQLAEEYRRSGNYAEAVKYCRAGLARHPGYLSARVTLGRALIETGGLDEAAQEFDLVLKSAPDNLAAIRGLAEIHQRRGEMAAALDYYKRALELARFDPELEETVNRIRREMGSVSSEPAEPANAGTAAEPAPGAGLIDFDALLATLGVPDAAPPPMMEMLLSQPASPPPPAPILTLPTEPPDQEQFAALERGLRESCEEAPATALDPAAVTALDELETWLRVLDDERDHLDRSRNISQGA